jgi:Type VI secretion system effector, Hcp
MLKKSLMLSLLGALSLINAAANAAVPATHAFTCDSDTPLNLTPVSFNFQIAQTLDVGSQSAGAGTGKVIFNPLTIKFAAEPAYADLLKAVESGSHFNSCTLTETVREARHRTSATVYQWKFNLVLLASLSAIGSDGSNTDSGGMNVPTGYMQATFEYGAIEYTAQ